MHRQGERRAQHVQKESFFVALDIQPLAGSNNQHRNGWETTQIFVLDFFPPLKRAGQTLTFNFSFFFFFQNEFIFWRKRACGAEPGNRIATMLHDGVY